MITFEAAIKDIEDKRFLADNHRSFFYKMKGKEVEYSREDAAVSAYDDALRVLYKLKDAYNGPKIRGLA